MKGFQQAFTGRNYITGERLSVADRWSEGIGSTLSLIPVPGLKYVGKYGAEEAIQAGKGIGKLLGLEGKSASKGLLHGEGKVGTYEDLIDAGIRGDNITPHHMPSAKYMKTNAGVNKNDGVSMNMEQPYPGTGGRHRQTKTYGLTGHGLQDYLNLSARDALASDIWDARRIYQKDKLYTPEIRKSLQDVIQMNRNMYPSIFKK